MKFFIVSILLIFQPISYACDAHKKEAGFKYESMKADTVYEKIGLKNGDLIQKYDNKKVKSAADALEMYSKLNKGKVKKIKILRDGVEQTIKVK